MRKILHLTNHLYEAGGAERQLLVNASALDRTRFENYICCLEKPRGLAKEAAQMGIPVFSLGVRGKPDWPKAVVRLGRLIRSLDIDLVHTTLADADLVGGTAARLVGRPAVNTFTGMTPDNARWAGNGPLAGAKHALFNKLRRFIYRTCYRHHIAVSQGAKESAVSSMGVPAKKVTVIYRGVMPNWLEPAPHPGFDHLRKSLGIARAGPVLLNVGRLIPVKGQRYLIQAMPKVLIQYPRAHLLIAGEGELRESLAALCRVEGVEDYVTFLGRRNDVKDLLMMSDIFVFPSLSEGCPNALLEALAVGKPCVAAHIGPTAEVVQDGLTGILVPTQSPDTLAEAVIYLSDHPEQAKAMGQGGRKTIAARFTIDTVIRQLEEVYDRVL